MQEQRETLLKEFKELIQVVGGEVSTNISRDVASAAAEALMQRTIFPELQQVEKDVTELLQKMPTAVKKLHQQVKGMAAERAEYHQLLQQQAQNWQKQQQQYDQELAAWAQERIAWQQERSQWKQERADW